MARRNTKADGVLSDAKKRLAWAQQRVADAEAQLGIANAALNAHQMNYDALEAALAPKPHAAPKKPAGATQGAADKDLKCGTCGNVKDHADHDRTYLKSHDFEPPKAGRKKREKKDPPAVIPVNGTDLVAEMELT